MRETDHSNKNWYTFTIPGVTQTFDRRLIFVINMIPLALALLQISSVNVAMPAISNSLGAQSIDIQWVLSGYALAFGILLVPSGRLGDIIGRSSVFTIGLAVFGIASGVCALAPSPILLNIARVFQGIGAGMQGPQTVGMIQQYFQGKGRARAYSLQGLVIAASVAIGPFATGLMINILGSDLGWRIPFALNLPLALIGCALALRWLPFQMERERKRQKQQRIRRHLDLDPFGALLITGAVVAVMLPFMLTELPTWRFSILLAAVVLVACWLAWERHYANRGNAPMVDLQLFKLRAFSFQTVISTVNFLGTTSIHVVTAMFLQYGLHWDALHAALTGTANAVLSSISALWAGRHVLRLKQNLVVAALAVFNLGIWASFGVIWLAANYDISPWWLAVTSGIAGLGWGGFGASNQTLAMMEVPVSMAGTAGGIKSMSERVATAIGNAVITGVLFSALAYTDWYGATLAANAVISSIAMLALLLAIFDVISSKRNTVKQAHCDAAQCRLP
ncbi:MAG: MFS transporter [Propionibacteriaceae bacterium]|nr:MFS transporter [Propionibacteriaceae bacterium]